jgi:predicted dienelactone hydrolase
MRCSSGRLVPLFAAVLLPVAFLYACAGGASSVAQPTPASSVDLSAPGPYPVGLTEIAFERPSSTTGEPRVLQTLVWYPAAESARNAPEDDIAHGVKDAPLTGDGLPLPIIMFSHGSGGLPWQSTYYTTHLASYGFVVVAPPHPGNTAADCVPCTDTAALADSLLNRPADIMFVLDSMLKLNDDPASVFYRALDGNRVGMSGHSFGGLITLQLAATRGANPFKAALAMAPVASGVPPTTTPIPLMIMGGGEDNVCPVENDREYLDSLDGSSPHYLLVFPRGGHLAYSDQCIELLGECGGDKINQEKAHASINRYATAFFETYVAGDQSYAKYLDPQSTAGDPDVEYQVWTPLQR